MNLTRIRHIKRYLLVILLMISVILNPSFVKGEENINTKNPMAKAKSDDLAVEMDKNLIYAKDYKSYALFVNGEEIRGPGFYTYTDSIYYKDGTVYVPISIVTGMGGDYQWNNDFSEMKVRMDSTSTWDFKWDGIMASGIFKGELREDPTNIGMVKAYFGDTLFVPLQFIEQYYPITVMKQDNTVLILVGEVPQQPTIHYFGVKGQYPSTYNFNPFDPNLKYPGGWKAPQLKAKWSSNEDKNHMAFEKELLFENGYTYGVSGAPNAIVLYDRNSGLKNSEVTIRFTGWGNPPGVPDKTISEAYRIPIISAQLFKFYFEKDWKRVWNYFNRGDIPDKFLANGRTVIAEYNNNSGTLYLGIGFKKTVKNKKIR